MAIITYNEITLDFQTSTEVFSPKGLDLGTKSMLENVSITEGDRILDLGCGFGFVGIYFSKRFPESQVVMTDISSQAIELSKINADKNNVSPQIVMSNGFEEIKDQKFDVILSNPPYHVDFSVPKEFIEGAYRQLSIGGRLYMVTKRKKWYENKIRSVFGYVRVIEVNDYFVFYSEKREKKQSPKKKEKKHSLSKKLQRKYQKEK